ncbi:MAG TPA: hypothetical protein VHF01_17515 [Candidatus Acidoferrum sp.]|nr:hypothetical protein [Candidatus Acidoferrum sp.]
MSGIVPFTQQDGIFAFMPLGAIGKITKVLIGSAAVSLATTLITAALTTYGVISIPAARLLLALAGIVLIAGITTSDYLCDRSWKHVWSVGLIAMLVIGSGLIWLDRWAVAKKTELDAHSTPPPLSKAIANPPAPPAIAFVKTPKRLPKPLAPSNTVKGNQNVTGNTVTGNSNVLGGQVCPNGICIGGDNNGTAIVNPQPPERNWVITEGICTKLLAPIRSTGSIKVSVGAFISDPDGANVVSQLNRCLPLVPGWSVTGAVLPPVPEAVTVVTSAENEPVARTLRDGLQSIGFDANLRLILDTPDIEVWIGKHAFKQQP